MAEYFQDGSFSYVTLIGVLATEAKSSQTKDGKDFTKITLKTTNSYTNKDGKEVVQEMVVPVSLWGKYEAPVGALVMVTGEVKSRPVTQGSKISQIVITGATFAVLTTTPASGVATMNRVEIIGNLGKDAEEIKNGNGGCRLSQAISKSTKVGDKYEKTTTWVDSALWGKRSKNILERAKKGSCVLVIGRLTTSTRKIDGEEKSLLSVTAEEVNIVKRAKDATTAGQGTPVKAPAQTPVDAGSVNEDDIPF